MTGQEVLEFLQKLTAEELKLPVVKSYYDSNENYFDRPIHDEISDISINDSWISRTVPLQKAIIVG